MKTIIGWICLLLAAFLMPIKTNAAEYVQYVHVTIAGTNLAFQWNSAIGDVYALEFQLDEYGPEWMEWEPRRMAIATTMSLLIPANIGEYFPKCFFRVNNLTGGAVSGITILDYDGLTGWQAMAVFKTTYETGTWTVRGSNDLGDFVFEQSGSIARDTNYLGEITALDTNSYPMASPYRGSNFIYWIRVQSPGRETKTRTVVSEIDRRPDSGGKFGLFLGLVGIQGQWDESTETNCPNRQAIVNEVLFRFNSAGIQYNLATMAPTNFMETPNCLTNNEAFRRLRLSLTGKAVFPPTYFYFSGQSEGDSIGDTSSAMKITAQELNSSGFSNKLTFAWISGCNVSSNFLAAMSNATPRTEEQALEQRRYMRWAGGYRGYLWGTSADDVPEEIKNFETRFFQAWFRGRSSGVTIAQALAYASVLPNQTHNPAADHFYWVGSDELVAESIVPDHLLFKYSPLTGR